MESEEVKSKICFSPRAWDALLPPLSEWILEAVSSMGFHQMSPVQASTIPLFMGYKDVVVEAVTGSGKTLAFLIPVVERLLRLEEVCKKHHVAAIIVSPTRELATQTYSVLGSLLAFHWPSAAALKITEDESPQQEISDTRSSLVPKILPQLVVGGSTSNSQDLDFFLKNSPNVLVATPGRLWELLRSPNVHCSQSSFEVLVLDEADRLLDLGFAEVLQKILGRLPKQRRTGLFSASVSEAVDQLIMVGLRNPVKIAVKVKSSAGEQNQITPTSLQMSYIVTPASHKLPTLFKLLQTLEPSPLKSILYLSTCAAVDYFQSVLPPILSRSGAAFTLIPLHGKHPPQARQKNFLRFSNATFPSILITTDVAARGLDIPQVDLVIQVDPPSDPKVFLHRCGRAGRAGRKGLAIICLQTGREEDYIPFLERRKTPVSRLETPDVRVSEQEAMDFSTQMRNLVRADRASYDKAQRGFVSWVQAYRKHQAKGIFQLTNLDWQDLGHAWALLRLPKMPELKQWNGDKSFGLNIDVSSLRYKDKQREVQRQQGLSKQMDISAEIIKSSNTPRKAWSRKSDEREERDKRRKKRITKRERDRWEAMTLAEREKRLELDSLIEKVRKRELEGLDEGFEGFSD